MSKAEQYAFDYLTRKQRGFALDFIGTKNATHSVMHNYYAKDKNVAKVMGHKLKKNPKVREYAFLKCKELGITHGSVASTLAGVLNGRYDCTVRERLNAAKLALAVFKDLGI